MRPMNAKQLTSWSTVRKKLGTVVSDHILWDSMLQCPGNPPKGELKVWKGNALFLFKRGKRVLSVLFLFSLEA